MTARRLETIEKITDAHLCTGCGVCTYLEPAAFGMVDVAQVGRRPLPIAHVNGRPRGDTAAHACPGARLTHSRSVLDRAPFGGEWGPIIEVYECWATDPDVRHRGSSGGVVSAVAAYAVTSGSAEGVLQVQARVDAPLQNETVFNQIYADIVAAAGSRYSPASPCERLDLVEAAEGGAVVIGKPCDIAATVHAAALRPRLAERIRLTIGIFCAGTPTTRGTEEAVQRLGVQPSDVERLDYRGEGWPGRFRLRTNQGQQRSMSYEESWGQTLQKHRQWRCMICPDHTGEFADLSIGDPWYRTPRPGEPGRSLVVVRTPRGRAAVLAALRDGAIAGHAVPLGRLLDSQPNLAATRGAVWGRVLAMRLAGLPAPRFSALPSFRMWLRLNSRAKVQSIIGTLRRIRRRGLRRPESELYGERSV